MTWKIDNINLGYSGYSQKILKHIIIYSLLYIYSGCVYVGSQHRLFLYSINQSFFFFYYQSKFQFLWIHTLDILVNRCFPLPNLSSICPVSVKFYFIHIFPPNIIYSYMHNILNVSFFCSHFLEFHSWYPSVEPPICCLVIYSSVRNCPVFIPGKTDW